MFGTLSHIFFLTEHHFAEMNVSVTQAEYLVFYVYKIYYDATY